MASGKIAFIASCNLPDWVRWHSSTKTNTLPLALNSLGMDCLSCSINSFVAASSSASEERPNLCTNEHISQGAG